VQLHFDRARLHLRGRRLQEFLNLQTQRPGRAEKGKAGGLRHNYAKKEVSIKDGSQLCWRLASVSLAELRDVSHYQHNLQCKPGRSAAHLCDQRKQERRKHRVAAIARPHPKDPAPEAR
jgi:hypothetical protein